MAKVALYPGIESDSAILSGKPVLTGTRLPVALILGQLGGGVTEVEIMNEYHVTTEQIHAALNYAASLINGESFMQRSHEWSFLIDENLPASLVTELRNQGHQAANVFDAGLQGQNDDAIYRYAQENKQTIITNDLDFSNIKHYSPPHHGVIVLRLPNSFSPSQRNRRVLLALQQLQGQLLENTLIIVELDRIRIRR